MSPQICRGGEPQETRGTVTSPLKRAWGKCLLLGMSQGLDQLTFKGNAEKGISLVKATT